MKLYHYTDTLGIAKQGCNSNKGRRRNLQGSGDSNPRRSLCSLQCNNMLVETRTRAVVIEQTWPAYKECAGNLVGVRTKMLRTTLDDKWIPDTKRLEGMLNTTTKMIVLNYPNNPTGKVLDKRTTEKIVSIAKDHGLYLLSDEFMLTMYLVNLIVSPVTITPRRL